MEGMIMSWSQIQKQLGIHQKTVQLPVEVLMDVLRTTFREGFQAAAPSATEADAEANFADWVDSEIFRKFVRHAAYDV
jgi:hypothetical protein